MCECVFLPFIGFERVILCVMQGLRNSVVRSLGKQCTIQPGLLLFFFLLTVAHRTQAQSLGSRDTFSFVFLSTSLSYDFDFLFTFCLIHTIAHSRSTSQHWLW